MQVITFMYEHMFNKDKQIMQAVGTLIWLDVHNTGTGRHVLEVYWLFMELMRQVVYLLYC